MFHPGTQFLIDRWSALPGARRVPARADLDPMALGSLLPRVFMAERSADRATFRLAGDWIERLHARPLRGLELAQPWREASRSMVAAAVLQAAGEGRPVVLTADAPRLRAGLEIVIAPLRGPTGANDRLIGFYQPLSATDRAPDSVGPLTVRGVMAAGALERAVLTLAAIDGRRVA